jgi:hypothetical protein
MKEKNLSCSCQRSLLRRPAYVTVLQWSVDQRDLNFILQGQHCDVIVVSPTTSLQKVKNVQHFKQNEIKL